MSASVQSNRTTQITAIDIPTIDLKKDRHTVKEVAIAILIAFPYFAGGPMWAIGNHLEINGLAIAGEVLVIGGAAFEGLLALIILKWESSRKAITNVAGPPSIT